MLHTETPNFTHCNYLLPFAEYADNDGDDTSKEYIMNNLM